MPDIFKEKSEELFEFCIYYNQLKNPLPAGGARARIVNQQLIILKTFIFDKLTKASFPALTVTHSRGNGRFPKVPWIAIHPVGTKVSSGLSVVICFARDGRGIVAGLMIAKDLKSTFPTVIRVNRRLSKDFLDVEGSSTTAYNNKFINPKEFYRGKFAEKELINHLEDSLKILFKPA
jgi:hypothetical protein